MTHLESQHMRTIHLLTLSLLLTTTPALAAPPDLDLPPKSRARSA